MQSKTTTLRKDITERANKNKQTNKTDEKTFEKEDLIPVVR